MFLTDDPVYLNQLPPFLDYVNPPWPGVLIGGRFPADVWPRQLMWAFEWCDTAREPSLEALRFLRWMAEQGRLEHEIAGPSSGEYTVQPVGLESEASIAEAA